MNVSGFIDALSASELKNNLSLDQLTTSGIATNYIPPTGVSYTDNLNNILNKTTIKRACCINKGRQGTTSSSYPVTVRIPTPAGYVYDETDPRNTIWKKYGYIDKTINIPDSMCTSLVPNYQYGTDKCDNFMGLYCKNIWNFYEDEVKQIGSKIDEDEFNKYKPECSCYMPQPSYITGAVAPACWAPGCDPNNNQCYQDANSRQKCNVTICTTNFNASNINAGGSATINSKVSQECGNPVNKPTQSTTKPTEIVNSEASSEVSSTKPIEIVNSETATQETTKPITKPVVKKPITKKPKPINSIANPIEIPTNSESSLSIGSESNQSPISSEQSMGSILSESLGSMLSDTSGSILSGLFSGFGSGTAGESSNISTDLPLFGGLFGGSTDGSTGGSTDGSTDGSTGGSTGESPNADTNPSLFGGLFSGSTGGSLGESTNVDANNGLIIGLLSGTTSESVNGETSNKINKVNTTDYIICGICTLLLLILLYCCVRSLFSKKRR